MAEENKVHFEWEAPEFKLYEKSFFWYTALCVVVLLLSLYQFFVADYLALCPCSFWAR